MKKFIIAIMVLTGCSRVEPSKAPLETNINCFAVFDDKHLIYDTLNCSIVDKDCLQYYLNRIGSTYYEATYGAKDEPFKDPISFELSMLHSHNQAVINKCKSFP